MSQSISAKDKKELDDLVDNMASTFFDLVEKLKELKINPKVEWIQTIHTILDSGVNGVPQLAFFDGDRSYTTWAEKRLEVCEDEEVDFEVKIGEETGSIPGTFNRANSKVELGNFMIDDTDVDLVAITFEYEGETHNVCLECLEGTINKSSCCSNCG